MNHQTEYRGTIGSSIVPLPSGDLASFIEKESGQHILRCYQCGKCSAGCPVAYAMDLTPRHVMRAVQLGLKSELLQSNSYWLCISCETCSVRCPREIDIAKVMESLRILALKEGIKPAEKDVELFHRLFLNLIEKRGRVHEMELAARYNMQGMHPFANLSLLPGMFSRGKISVLPPRVNSAKEVKRIFAKVREVEERESHGGNE